MRSLPPKQPHGRANRPILRLSWWRSKASSTPRALHPGNTPHGPTATCPIARPATCFRGLRPNWSGSHLPFGSGSSHETCCRRATWNTITQITSAATSTAESKTSGNSLPGPSHAGHLIVRPPEESISVLPRRLPAAAFMGCVAISPRGPRSGTAATDARGNLDRPNTPGSVRSETATRDPRQLCVETP